MDFLLNNTTKNRPYYLYEEIRSMLHSLKGEYDRRSYLQSDLDETIVYIENNKISEELIKKSNFLKSQIDMITKDIRAIESCSSEILGFSTFEYSLKKNKKKTSFKDCLLQFVKNKNGASFTPSELSQFIAETRHQQMSSSVRVFAHRVIKDLLLQNKIKKISYGEYSLVESQ